MPLHSNANPEPLRVFDVTPKTSEKQLATTVATLTHEGEKVLPQGGGVYVGEGLPPVPLELAKKIRSGDYIEMEELLLEVRNLEDDIPSEPKRQCSRHIYVAAMFRCIRQHSRGTSTGGYPGAHGLHDNDHQGEQGVFRDRMEELRHAIPQARSFKEGHQLVCYQPDQMPDVSRQQPGIHLGASYVWRSPTTRRTAASGISHITA